MRFDEQGTMNTTRYLVVPRTLCFISTESQLLLLRGAPDKRLWANLLNGLGGHLEPGEDPLSGARRELCEEAGLSVPNLALRAVIHVSGQADHPGVMLFVCCGTVRNPHLRPGSEGSLEWHPLDALPWKEMVEDLPHLLPRLWELQKNQLLYGVYTWDAAGNLARQWSVGPSRASALR